MKNQLLAIEALGRVEPEARPQLRLIANRVNDDYLGSLQDAAAKLGVDVALLVDVDDVVLVDEYRSSRALVATRDQRAIRFDRAGGIGRRDTDDRGEIWWVPLKRSSMG